MDFAAAASADSSLARKHISEALTGPFFADDTSHSGGWASFVIPIPTKLDWPIFTLWLSSLLYTHGSKILRVKGLIRTTSSDGPLITHGVQHVMHPPTHLRPEEDSGEEAFLVFITDGLERRAIENSLYRFQDYSVSAKSLAEVA